MAAAVRGDGHDVASVREAVASRLAALDLDELRDDALLIANELVTNALLHGGGLEKVEVIPTTTGVRLEVHDRGSTLPFVSQSGVEAMTGRGLKLVAAVAAEWGAERTAAGKTVWAEVDVDRAAARPPAVNASMSDELRPARDGSKRYHVSLGEVPTDLLIEAKSHVDNVVREFALVSRGASSGTTASIPTHLATLIDVVVHQFSEARDTIKRQAAAAARQGQKHVHLELELPIEAADAGERYLAALDEVDTYCRAARLLTLESPPQHRVFRTWYVQELVAQLRSAANGGTPREPQTFEERLLAEVDQIARAQQLTERAARLYDVSAALAVAATPEAVARAVLEQGVGALRAAGGGILLVAEGGRFDVPATLGYEEDVVGRLRSESQEMALPAAAAFRTGEPVWLESREERDARFPELSHLERDTISMCAVPLVARTKRLGAMRFSFREARLFDDDERRFVLALAAQAAQALDRAQLYDQRIDLSRRLQRSLLPGRLPEIEGMGVGAIYHPASDGMELGGDFYDVWAVPSGRWAFAIGDASGTGPEAGAITAVVRFTLRALTAMDIGPVAVLDRLNRAILDLDPDPDRGERFCTVLLGVITPGEQCEIDLAGGGHPAPFVRRAEGGTSSLDVGGSLVGALDDARMASARAVLGPGDALVLFTDGATEARRDRKLFGADGVRRAVDDAPPSAQGIVDSIQHAVFEHTGNGIQDDLAALVLRVDD